MLILGPFNISICSKLSFIFLNGSINAWKVHGTNSIQLWHYKFSRRPIFKSAIFGKIYIIHIQPSLSLSTKGNEVKWAQLERVLDPFRLLVVTLPPTPQVPLTGKLKFGVLTEKLACSWCTIHPLSFQLT